MAAQLADAQDPGHPVGALREEGCVIPSSAAGAWTATRQVPRSPRGHPLWNWAGRWRLKVLPAPGAL